MIRWAVLVVVTGALLSAIAPVGAALLGDDVSAMHLMADPAETTGEPWFTGMVSDFGLFLWASAAVLFSLLTLSMWRAERRPAILTGLLCAMTLALLLDDHLMLHEIVYPWLFGASEGAVFALYALAAVVIVVLFRQELLARRESLLLAFALTFLAASVGLDVWGADSEGRRIAEEAAKLTGILAWMAFPAAIVVHGLGSGPVWGGAGRRRANAKGETGSARRKTASA